MLDFDGIADQVPQQNLERWIVVAGVAMSITNVAYQQICALRGFGYRFGLWLLHSLIGLAHATR